MKSSTLLSWVATTAILFLSVASANPLKMRPQAPTQNSIPNGSQLVPDQYIVVFKKDAGDEQIDVHEAWIQEAATVENSTLLTRRAGVFERFPRLPLFKKFRFVQKFAASLKFKGYAAQMSAEIAETVKTLPEVALVEQDSIGTFVASQAAPPNWGLARMSQASLPLPNAYTYPDAAGAGVDVYLLDTGIDVSHPDFGGRAVFSPAANFAGDGQNTDVAGHGTWMAGAIGSKTYGVAKSARLIAIKIGVSTNFLTSNAIAGLQYVASEISKSGRKSIINLSLIVPKSDAMDTAVSSLLAISSHAVPIVAAAGNAAENSCELSPARLPLVLTVGASTSGDAVWPSSGRGSCVDFFAPGVDIATT
ncbi:Proprotein convertase subtilisin/kexin type 9, partial [Dinochytrium kinnereticum]